MVFKKHSILRVALIRIAVNYFRKYCRIFYNNANAHSCIYSVAAAVIAL